MPVTVPHLVRGMPNQDLDTDKCTIITEAKAARSVSIPTDFNVMLTNVIMLQTAEGKHPVLFCVVSLLEGKTNDYFLLLIVSSAL